MVQPADDVRGRVNEGWNGQFRRVTADPSRVGSKPCRSTTVLTTAIARSTLSRPWPSRLRSSAPIAIPRFSLSPAPRAPLPVRRAPRRAGSSPTGTAPAVRRRRPRRLPARRSHPRTVQARSRGCQVLRPPAGPGAADHPGRLLARRAPRAERCRSGHRGRTQLQDRAWGTRRGLVYRDLCDARCVRRDSRSRQEFFDLTRRTH